MFLPNFLSFLSLPLLASSLTLTLSIPPSPPLLSNPHTLSPSTHATLQAHRKHLTAPLSRANTLVFANLTTGSYLLDIHCRDLFFAPLRVDVSATTFTTPKEGGGELGELEEVKGWEIEAWRTYRGNEWDNKGQRVGGGKVKEGEEGEVVVEMRPLGGKEYYQQRAGFSVLSFLKNPMILMALFSLGLIVGLPYLMDNMDEETKKEFQEIQSKRGPASDPASAIQNFDIAGFLAGRGGGGSSGSQQSGGGDIRRR